MQRNANNSAHAREESLKEKHSADVEVEEGLASVRDGDAAVDSPEFKLVSGKGGLGVAARRLRTWGVEARGIFPVPVEERKDRQFYKVFFVWFSANFNVLSFSAGTVGPVIFGLGLRDSSLVILFFNLLCCIPPAYFTTWGPKLGMRQMCQARYSFGYYGVMLPSILNLITMVGFSVLNCILGGQTLAAVTSDNLSWSVGIVIIAVLSLLISFCGFKVLTWYERLAWIPVLITYLVAIGLGAKHLSDPPPPAPATAKSVLTFASTIAGFVLTFSPLSSDYTNYYEPSVSGWRIFWYSYFGFLIPIAGLQCLGAAFAVSAPLVPLWTDAYSSGAVGDLLAAVLSPAGGFGKFLTVLLSLSVTANIAVTIYSFGLSFQVFAPVCSHVPRYVFSVLAIAIVIPLSIIGAHRFYETLINFLGLISYWASCFIAVLLTEHFVFRTPTTPTSSSTPSIKPNRFAAYNPTHWNTPSLLPSGIPAILASLLSFGLVVPCMEQVWFEGPIARTTGDIGFEVALVLTAVFYLPLRWLEIKVRGRV